MSTAGDTPPNGSAGWVPWGADEPPPPGDGDFSVGDHDAEIILPTIGEALGEKPSDDEVKSSKNALPPPVPPGLSWHRTETPIGACVGSNGTALGPISIAYLSTAMIGRHSIRLRLSGGEQNRWTWSAASGPRADDPTYWDSGIRPDLESAQRSALELGKKLAAELDELAAELDLPDPGPPDDDTGDRGPGEPGSVTPGPAEVMGRADRAPALAPASPPEREPGADDEDPANGAAPAITSAAVPPLEADPAKTTIAVDAGGGHLAVREALKVLSEDRSVYVHADGLVMVGRAVEESDDTPDPAGRVSGQRGIRRPADAKVIRPVSAPRLWEHLGHLAHWERFDARAKRYVPCDPPMRIVSSVHARGQWPGMRELRGIVSAPILRPDGSVSMASGYDDTTGLYCDCSVVPAMPSHPTRDDARAAAGLLLDLVSNVPFAAPSDKTAWLAGLLGPIAFPAYDGLPPIIVIDATTQGSGKGLITDVIGIIATGQRMTMSPCPTAPPKFRAAADDEMRKRVMAHALAGDFLVCIDNVPRGGMVGWPALDMATTAERVGDRILGESRNARAVVNFCLYVTGNNLIVVGDTMRRSLRCRIEPEEERPHERPSSSFRYPDLLGHVRANRSLLLGAALTIPTAYLLAGAPRPDDLTLGSFGGWCRVVRDSMVWAGIGDPLSASCAKDPDADPDVAAHVAVIEALRRLDTGGGLTTAKLLELAGQSAYIDERRAIVEWCPSPKQDGSLPSADQLGRRLRGVRGRWRELSDGCSACIDRPAHAEKAHGSGALWTVRARAT